MPNWKVKTAFVNRAILRIGCTQCILKLKWCDYMYDSLFSVWLISSPSLLPLIPRQLITSTGCCAMVPSMPRDRLPLTPLSLKCRVYCCWLANVKIKMPNDVCIFVYDLGSQWKKNNVHLPSKSWWHSSCKWPHFACKMFKTTAEVLTCPGKLTSDRGVCISRFL